MPLSWYLILAAALFCIGLYGVLSHRNLVVILMSLELMLNAININLIAFSRYLEPGQRTGMVFALFVYVVAAAEAALGLALVIAIWRNRDTVAVEEIDTLKG
ncbi:MAG: NADH-quinone oxidoreductase subunit NuoK [Anaerolineae bacterium]|nr:NADH-quinone oxidoreductase subunit NuoK [Anaerolineae bacterium]